MLLQNVSCSNTPIPVKYIYFRFRKTHERQRDTYASWPAEATRRKLINEYWSDVLWHYLLMVVVAAVAGQTYWL